MDTVTLDALGPGAASAIIMLLADARLPAGAHVTSNGVEAGLRRGLAPREVAAYMRARMRTVVRVEAGTAVVTRHALIGARVVDDDEVDRGGGNDREPGVILADIKLAVIAESDVTGRRRTHRQARRRVRHR